MVKVQLLLVVDQNFLQWKDWLNKVNLNDYYAVDILYFGPSADTLSLYGDFLTKPNIFLHWSCLPLESQLNYLIREDVDYYVINSQPDTLPDKVAQKLSEKHVILVKPDGDGYNNLVAYRAMSEALHHFGQQDVATKLEIHLRNYEMENFLYDNITEFANENS